MKKEVDIRDTREYKKFLNLMTDKNIVRTEEPETEEGFFVLHYRNGAVFRCRGKIVSAYLYAKNNGIDQTKKAVKPYRTPKKGEKIGVIHTEKGDKIFRYFCRVIAVFECLGERIEVRRGAHSVVAYHANTGYYVKRENNLAACVDSTISTLHQIGKEKFLTAIKEAERKLALYEIEDTGMFIEDKEHGK